MNIITGYRAEPHITAQQDMDVNIGIFGASAHILKGVGSEMAATVISANEVEIADGTCVCQGCTAEVPYGTTESMAIENGTQGKQRIDLIVARYTKNSVTGVEDMLLVVIKGTPASTFPASPTYNEGKIADGDSPVDFPIYRVNLDGITITSVDRLAGLVNIKESIDDLEETVDAHGNQLTALQNMVNSQMFLTHSYEWDNVTINADWYKQELAYSITRQGYKAVGIVGFGTYPATSDGINSNWCLFQKCEVYERASQDRLDFYVWNQNKNAAAKVRIVIRVLYVRSGLVSSV